MEAAAPAERPGASRAPTASMRAAVSEAVHSVLGTSMPLSQITQVRMHVFGKCKMGISFWPSFGFKAQDREEEPGSVRLIHGSPALATPPPPAAAPASPPTTSPAATPSSAGSQPQQPTVAAAVLPVPAAAGSPPGAEAAADSASPRELLHLSFTKDPPDEFHVGAHALGCISFPFITIRTDKLEGTLDPQTGAVALTFNASFIAQMGNREPTHLAINATLTTEAATAFKTKMQGERLAGGQGVLVSAAEVPKTPNWFANLILWLPTTATARLPVRFEFS